MSFDSPNKEKKERSCHLTLKQYNIVVSYLNTGIKPSVRSLEEADLVENLNGGVNKSGRFHRLKSIASRLSLRSTDGALLYANNGKVVLPSTKFVQTIKQAHKGTGDKHLNCSQTLAKLQETYAIGRRQFGICEDQVRDIVKSCNQGSCHNSKRRRQESSGNGTPAKKAKLDSEDKCQETTKDKGSELLKTLLAVNMYQSPAQGSYTNYIPKQPGNFLAQTLSNSIVPLENTPTGLNNPNCIFVVNPTFVVPSSSLTDLKSFISPQKPCDNLSPVNPSASQTSYVYVLPSTQAVETPLQVQETTSISQPKFVSNLIHLQNQIPISPSNVNLMCNPFFSIPVLYTPQNDTQTHNATNSFSDVSSIINSFSSSVDETNSCKSPQCSVTTLLETGEDVRPPQCTDLSDDEETSAEGKKDEPVVADGDDTQSASDGDKVPFPNIWHYYKDFSVERNPYQKIYIGIQDMKLDLMKSIVGDVVAAERLKKKINYVDYLVKVQKTATEPYKLDALETQSLL